MRYRWLLLDADGTLFDYDKAEAVALEKTFEQAGLGFQSSYVHSYRQINGQIWLAFERGEIEQERLRTQRFKELFESLNVTSDPELFSREYLKNLGARTDLIDGALEILQALHGRIGMVLITNGIADVQRSRIARSGIGAYFEDIVISEEVGFSKPDGRIFEVAFDKMGRPKREEVLIVGDSLTSDIKGGSDYGIDTCWYNPEGKPRPAIADIRYEITTLDELLNIVE